MAKIDWNSIDRLIEHSKSQGVKPTMRALFHDLCSRGLLPNTESGYRELSKHLEGKTD